MDFAESQRYDIVAALAKLEAEVAGIKTFLTDLKAEIRAELVPRHQFEALEARVADIETYREDFEAEMRAAKKAVIRWIAGVLAALVTAAGAYGWSHIDISFNPTPPAITQPK
ncbi:hypothetical protein [Azospirillum sp. sgz301742]